VEARHPDAARGTHTMLALNVQVADGCKAGALQIFVTPVGVCCGLVKEVRSSFLKKRTKSLLRPGRTLPDRTATAT
jgi:hypothetical protein